MIPGEMLREIRISNLAVVRDTVLRFGSGMNVLTGSTGAGKSIILTAVSLLSGKRAEKSLIRKGEKELFIEGRFRISSDWRYREKLGVDEDENELSIRRKISRSGKSRIWVNGISSTNSVAREITGDLLKLQGQHEQQDLLDKETHIHYLDSQGEYVPLLESCRSKIAEFRGLHEELARLRKEAQENREKKDFIAYQYEELSRLKIKPGLKEELKSRIARKSNYAEFMSALSESKKILDEREGNVIQGLGGVGRNLEKISSFDRRWKEESERIESILLDLNEISNKISGSLEDVPPEDDNLEKLQESLAGIQRAERKYARSCGELIEYRERLGSILRELEEGSDEIIEATEKLEKLKEELIPLLERLSEKRKENAEGIDSLVTSQLREMGIRGAMFQTRVERLEINALSSHSDELDLPSEGWDDVEFMIRTNVGEEMRPLSKIVSGGELSRVSMVLKGILVMKKGIPTLIFDEIDSGLGADTGEKVAAKMKELSQKYQIICITHLAQIAAPAERHFVITKEVVDERTVSSAREVKEHERIGEIARMLGGEKELSFELASTMLDRGETG